MDFWDGISKLGPVGGTVAVVIIFIWFAREYMKNERAHREKLAGDCHEVQRQATEATFKAIGSIEKNSAVLEKVNVTLIRMNGHRKQGE